MLTVDKTAKGEIRVWVFKDVDEDNFRERKLVCGNFDAGRAFKAECARLGFMLREGNFSVPLCSPPTEELSDGTPVYSDEVMELVRLDVPDHKTLEELARNPWS